MNKQPLWKSLLLFFVVGISTLYALPVLYPEETAIQISGASASVELDEQVQRTVEQALDQYQIAHKPVEWVGGSLRYRVDDEKQQKAHEVVQHALGENYVVALNLAPTTPEWLQALGARPMNLGLDLRGGVHFLLEVDLDSAIARRIDTLADEVRSTLRDELPKGVRYKRVTLDGKRILVEFNDAAGVDAGRDVIASKFQEFIIHNESNDEQFLLSLALNEFTIKQIQDHAIDQNRTAINNRVNELGVAEPLVQRQGINRLVVELPGVQDTATAKRVIGKTATLEFRMVDDRDNRRGFSGVAPPGTELLPFKRNERAPVLLKKRVIVEGDNVIGAKSGLDENGQPQVNITLDSAGGKKMAHVTKNNIGKPMAVVFIENKTRVVRSTNADGQEEVKLLKSQTREVINVATIQGVFSNKFRITGLDSPAEAAELALLLRAGALAAPMYFVEERTIGPSLGKENIAAGINSMKWGVILVMVFMVLYYRVFGLIANLALVANLVILVAIMSLLGATLTLPGIAGIVLTVGMAVDANVLIFSRIREELKSGRSPSQAIHEGYDNAFSTILDANITTLIVGIILIAAATGAVQGFAVTLSIGILTSMFTAILGTRVLVGFVYGGKSPRKLAI